MSSAALIQTLWDLIGERVAHVRGGDGVLVNAFSSKLHFTVQWDDPSSAYTRVVPAEALTLGGAVLSELIRSDDVLRNGLSAWDTFSFVSKSKNPEQFLQSDQQRVEELLKRSIQDARAAYSKSCSFWWHPDEFERTAQSIAEQLRRDSARRRVEQMLAEDQVGDARRYFKTHCSAWWPIDSFNALVARAEERIARRIAEEKEKAEQAKRLEERRVREERRKEVLERLGAGDFEAADGLVERYPGTFDEREYASIRKHHWDEEERRRVEIERGQIRAEVGQELHAGRIDAADALYSSRCSEWWPEQDYLFERRRAVKTKLLLEHYSGSSLARLDEIFADHLDGEITSAEFARMKAGKIGIRLARIGLPLSAEQVAACGVPDRHRLVTARAGSGKTRVLAALSALVIQDEALDPNQVLVLAFNRKAAAEIGERIQVAAGVSSFNNARTFHALAYQLADLQGRTLIFDDGELSLSRRKQSGFMQRLFPSLMTPVFREKLYEFFRRELDQLDELGSGLTGADYVTFRRSMTDHTLGGENVKSNGEKFIADFLFEHGIEYRYEKGWAWLAADHSHGSPYCPDFSLKVGGRDLIIEHWAFDPQDPEARVPSWWATSTQEYRKQIMDKREFWAARGIPLIETHAGLLRSGREAFEASLRDRLETAGVQCRKLAWDELAKKVAEVPRTVSRMASLFLQFISRSKKMGWDLGEAEAAIGRNPDPEARNRAFHTLGLSAFSAYQAALEHEDALDFDDLLRLAAEAVDKEGVSAQLHLGKGMYVRIIDLRWIMVDEFQDFSEPYLRLLNAILRVNPSVRVVAVGDDWQAINGFAGANLKYFERFGDYFPRAGGATISSNHRSGAAIVAAGNGIMAGRGIPARALHEGGEWKTVALDKTRVPGRAPSVVAATSPDGYVNWNRARALQACADYIADSVYTVGDDDRRWIPSVLILARTGFAYGVDLAEFGRLLGSVLRQHAGLHGAANRFVTGGVKSSQNHDASIEVMTAHRSKGKEADTVIVLDVSADQFPKVHSDNQLFLPFGTSPEDVLAEERRLFYVTVTRAQSRLLFLTDSCNPSPYLTELQSMTVERPQAGPGTGVDAASTEFGGFLTKRLVEIDRLELIRDNIGQEAVALLDSVESKLATLPVVGYQLNGLNAELAWPEAATPTAILTGRDRAHAGRWRSAGWEVICAPDPR